MCDTESIEGEGLGETCTAVYKFQKNVHCEVLGKKNTV